MNEQNNKYKVWFVSFKKKKSQLSTGARMLNVWLTSLMFTFSFLLPFYIHID